MRLFKRLMPVLMFALLVAVAVQAEIAEVISYQGRLLDAGSPVADGDYQLQFEIFDEASAGSSLWSSGFRTVPVADGLFHYLLGDSVALPDDLFANDAEVYLEVTVQGDGPISPRTRLTSASYAYHALRADSSEYSLYGPGVTQKIVNASVDLMNGFSVLIAEDSILCPRAGYVMLEATTSASADHTPGADCSAVFSFRDSVGGILTNQENYFILYDNFPPGRIEFPINIHTIYEVVPGYNRFEFTASDFGDAGQTISARRTKFTLTFFDRTYGTVDLPPAFRPPPASSSRVVGPISDEQKAVWMEQSGISKK